MFTNITDIEDSNIEVMRIGSTSSYKIVNLSNRIIS